MPGMVHNIRIVFGAQTQPSITIQQSDYNSRTIQAACFTSSGTPMDFSDTTVTVVYNAGADPTKEYPVTVNGNVLSFTMPGLAAQTAGSWSMQIFIYWAGSLLHSAVIPYTVKASLEPGQGQEDQVPLLVLLVQKAQEAIAGANEAASTANQAAGSANSAANSANEKAGIAASAANSANEAASNAATMASLAQTATANANSAANSASNAAESANQAAASANAAAASASQVAADVQQKADSGAFNGKNGLDAPQIDDTQITTTNPWSSMQIVKTVCPPFTVSGSVVQCYPVANYPLSVQASWDPRQEGEGDPSPENIRPIVGLDRVQVTRGGANLYNADALVAIKGNANTYGYGVPADDLIIGKTYTISVNAPTFSFKISDYLSGYNSVERSNIVDGKYTFVMARNSNIQNDLQQYVIVGIDTYVNNLVSSPEQAKSLQISICAGEDAMPYEPYTGSAAMLTLPETIYGGELDAVTGEGVETVHGIVLDGTELWLEDSAGSTGLEYFYYDVYDTQRLPSSGGSHALAKLTQKISHFAIGNPYSEIVDNAGWVYSTGAANCYGVRIRMSACADVNEWKSYLAAQFAAGTPVTIVYKLATPTQFQATGGQSLPALPGTNTLYADAGNITVSGASDPIATITSLQNRVSALESAQTEM